MNDKVGITVYLSKDERDKLKAICKENNSDMAKTLAAHAKKIIKGAKK